MLRKVECDNIFVLAKSGDIANTESHIIMALTESGGSCINKSPCPQRRGGHKVPDTQGEKARGCCRSCWWSKPGQFSSGKAVAGLISKV